MKIVTIVLITRLHRDSLMQARPLKTKELADPEISGIIAEKMAMVHSLDVPISKEPSWIWDTMNRWMSNAKAQPPNSSSSPHPPTTMDALRRQLDAEMDWMRNYLDQIRSPVVFCHNEYVQSSLVDNVSIKMTV